MKCLTFTGEWYNVAELFNKWAKGKMLAKDVIIHSHQNVFEEEGRENLFITIVVFFDEKLHEDWVGKDPWKKAADEVMEERKAKELTIPA